MHKTPEQYGYAGGDATAAIQAALDDPSCDNLKLCGSSAYPVTSTLHVRKPGQSIQCGTIVAKHSGVGILGKFRGLHVRSVNIRGNQKLSTGIWLDDGSDDSVIEKCCIQDIASESSADGILVKQADRVHIRQNKIVGIYSSNGASRGIRFSEPNGSSISARIFANTIQRVRSDNTAIDGDGVVIQGYQGLNDIWIYGNKLTNPGKRAFKFQSDGIHCVYNKAFLGTSAAEAGGLEEFQRTTLSAFGIQASSVRIWSNKTEIGVDADGVFQTLGNLSGINIAYNETTGPTADIRQRTDGFRFAGSVANSTFRNNSFNLWLEHAHYKRFMAVTSSTFSRNRFSGFKSAT